MSLNNSYEINGYSLEHVRNRHELRVIKSIKSLAIRTPEFDGCSLCLEDVYAISLNQIPPHYIQQGGIILRNPPPTAEQLQEIVSKAMEKVISQPNHP